MRYFNAFVFSSILFLSGCAGSIYDIDHQTPDQLKTANSDMVCEAAAMHHKPTVIAELVRRGLIRPQYEPYVATGNIVLGMTTEEMQCTYPLVESTSDVSSMGEIIVWTDGGDLDVATTNGIVTSVDQF